MKEDVQIYLTDFLRILQERVPHEVSHNIRFENNQLILLVRVPRGWQTVIFDEEFDNREPSEVIDSLIEDMRGVGHDI